MSMPRGHKTDRSFEAHIQNVWMEPNTGCWLWPGGVRNSRLGYGVTKRNGKRVLAHRVSYEIHKGPIPEGLEVRHICDVPLCVNPEHLLVGTHKQNMEDMGRRKRNTSVRKLTSEQVEIIRSSALSHRALAERFGVSHRNIGAVKSGQTWKEI